MKFGKAVGENTPEKQGSGKNQEQQITGKGAKKSATALAAGKAATRSASRNAGASIVNLDDYKSGKDEGTSKNHNSSQAAQKSTNRTVSKARNPNSEGHSEVAKPSGQRAEATTNREQQPSPHRNPAVKMEGQKEVAFSRESDKYLTQWEAQQQINIRNANPPTETVKRSESREPKVKDSKQRK